MEKKFWHQCWENNHIGFHQQDYHPFLENYFAELLNGTENRIFVPLCGKSKDLIWLANFGKVVGSELSEVACSAFFDENDVPASINSIDEFTCYSSTHVGIWQGDFFKLTNRHIGQFDWVYDRAALVALPEAMQTAYVNHLKALLVPNTRIFLTSVEFPQHEHQGPPFVITQEKIEELFKGYSVKKVAELSHQDKVFAQRPLPVSYLTETLYIISQC